MVLNARLFQIAGTRHRFLAYGETPDGPMTKFLLIPGENAPSAKEIFPALRHIAQLLGGDVLYTSDEMPDGYRTSGRDRVQSSRWTLYTQEEGWDRQVAQIQLEENCLTFGLIGPIEEMLLLIRLSGHDALTFGWESVELEEFEVRLFAALGTEDDELWSV